MANNEDTEKNKATGTYKMTNRLPQWFPSKEEGQRRTTYHATGTQRAGKKVEAKPNSAKSSSRKQNLANSNSTKQNLANSNSTKQNLAKQSNSKKNNKVKLDKAQGKKNQNPKNVSNKKENKKENKVKLSTVKPGEEWHIWKKRQNKKRKEEASIFFKQKEEESSSQDLKKSNIRISFIGGIGEIGKNMTLIEYENDMIMIDAGQSFPDETLPGVDSVLQDLTYLEQNKNKLRALFITHGHEDHIGGILQVLKVANPTIYGSGISLGLIDGKLREARIDMDSVTLKKVDAGSTVKVGEFTVEFVSVTHSIPGAFGLSITTKLGTIFHTGDFKIDGTPVKGDYCDLKRIAEIGRRGVLLLMCDSTNVERQGFSVSESVVGNSFKEIFEANRNKRIIIATFASNIRRMQQIIDLAEKYKRKVAFTGRSMLTVSEMAMKQGEIKYNKEQIIDIDEVDRYENKEIVIISTGSQGEVMSALSRISLDDFEKVKLDEDDVVVLSSSPIPGNERNVNNLINQLYRKNCKIITNEDMKVHASGHAYKEEIKIMLSLAHPKFFIPVHGEYRHLKNQQLVAMEYGMKERNIIIPELGMQVELAPDFIKVAGNVPAGDMVKDGTAIASVNSDVIRDRLNLSRSGVCVINLRINKKTNHIASKPYFRAKGFVYEDEAGLVLGSAQKNLFETFKDVDFGTFKNRLELETYVRKTTQSFFTKRTKRRPMIIPIVTII